MPDMRRQYDPRCLHSTNNMASPNDDERAKPHKPTLQETGEAHMGRASLMGRRRLCGCQTLHGRRGCVFGVAGSWSMRAVSRRG